MNKVDPFTALIFLVAHVVACIAASSSFLKHFAESNNGGYVLWDILFLQINMIYAHARLLDLAKLGENNNQIRGGKY